VCRAARLGYSAGVSPLFRRKPADVVSDAAAPPPEPKPAGRPTPPGKKSYTPSKKELGVETPKRVAQRRRVADAPADRKEAARQLRDRQRQERAEASAGMRAGDPKYLLPRDRGPERALVRDIVDSRRTVGTWFFGGALVVMATTLVRTPLPVQLFGNVLWGVLAVAVVGDSILISRKIRRLVRERYPHSTERTTSLGLYGAMRGLTFRRMRIPKPQVEIGAKI
jgi:Protein of unknown function (DUF3043)